MQVDYVASLSLFRKKEHYYSILLYKAGMNTDNKN